MKNKNKLFTGFTLIELMVAVSIVGILSSIIYASFGDARAQARDKARMTALKEVQLALEMFKAQTGSYPIPTPSCSGGASDFFGPGPVGGATGFAECVQYIPGLVPDYISELPTDVMTEDVAAQGFFYRSDGTSYKLMVKDSVEILTVVAGDEFARCPSLSGACATGIPANTYAVYSGAGAVSW